MNEEISPKARPGDGLQIRYPESDAVAEPTVLLLNPRVATPREPVELGA